MAGASEQPEPSAEEKQILAEIEELKVRAVAPAAGAAGGAFRPG